jgi:eukaryotic-like serine/threonine-protein kinase
MNRIRGHRLGDEIPIEDFKFLMKTELLEATSERCKRPLISSMKRIQIHAGDRFISQGDIGDCFYVIQQGSCVVSLEKEGQSYPVSRLESRDIVGEVAILTGEARSASVDAETDMVLWALNQKDYENISLSCPDIQEFLADLATERLCSQKITADRCIGKYTINDIVAEGGWSIVYKGVHSLLNLPVAIKMLKHNVARDSDFLGKFQNEARIIASLNHENIVKVYDIELVYRTAFIIMEYLSGVTLRHILKKRLRLPYPRMLQILLQVCEGLNYAHEQGIVHQDVKPGNIFIQRSDRVKLVDFGLASPIGGCSPDLPGTAFYMAPEQIESEPVGPGTDIYSLGITAYEMATGQRPFPDDICAVLKAHITQPTPDPRLLNPDLPGEFCEFIARSTQKDPAARYDNLGQVMVELGSMVKKAGQEILPHSEPTCRATNLLIMCKNEHQSELNRLMESFSEQLKTIGAELRICDCEDVQ